MSALLGMISPAAYFASTMMGSNRMDEGPTGQKQLGGNTGGNIIPKGYSFGQIKQYTPEQEQLFSSLFGNVGKGSYLNRLASGDEDIFNQIEAPQFRQFNELQGQMGARYGMGGGQGSLGLRRSSGFQNANTAANQTFAQQLGANRQQLQRQALMDMMGISETLLNQRPYDRFVAEKPQKQNSFLQNLALSLSGGIGQGIGQAGSAFLGGL